MPNQAIEQRPIEQRRDQAQNPYAAPAAEGAAPQAVGLGQLATRGQRFATVLLDYVGSILFGLVVGVVIGLLGIDLEALPDQIFGIVLMLAYYITFEGIWGRTLGKLLMGTRVVNHDGGVPSFGQILKRSLCRFIPFEPFSFLASEVGWHDSISRTRVVRTRP